ncbi:MAG: hypothetical protein B6242_07850 [Anaerolineaceae bacterium 4572_78]|nr:MAG: hypothetical protein B6242_07850 [Anaerolineaceae bacterium 4572_78]
MTPSRGDFVDGCKSLYADAASTYHGVISSNNPTYMDSIAYKKRGCLNFFLENYDAQKKILNSIAKKQVMI